MIAIIDYGLGNIQAFVNVYRRLQIPVCVATSADMLAAATKLILPGVGAFDHAMARLNASGMREKLDELVRNENMPILGICVGMQMLADGSDEGGLPGLGWIPGRVRALADTCCAEKLPLPHMGWNDVKTVQSSVLFSGLEDSACFYFLHAYYFQCNQPEHAVAVTTYGLDFTCAVADENIHGVQFHPEKSHGFGVTLLKNFAECQHAQT